MPAGTSRRAQIALLSDEDVWPYLLIDDIGAIDRLRQEGCVSRALAEGRRAAGDMRINRPERSLDAILTELGVKVIESDEDPKIAWRYRRSEYLGQPPRIVVYRQALLNLGALADEAGLAAAFPAADMRELVLAHELYHHIAFTTLGQVSERCRLPWIRLGPLTLRRRVPALDEVAAHVFAQTLLDLPISPAILDWLTLYPDQDRLDAFVGRAERLVKTYGLQ